MAMHVTSLTERIEDDHRHLKIVLAQLVEALDADAPSSNFLEWKLDFLARMRDFRHQLIKHFDLEEEGGFMETVLRTAPQFAGKVERLEEEHIEIMNDLDRAIDVFKDADCASSSKIVRVRQRVRELVKALDAHESVETELIQNTYNQDLGMGD